MAQTRTNPSQPTLNWLFEIKDNRVVTNSNGLKIPTGPDIGTTEPTDVSQASAIQDMSETQDPELALRELARLAETTDDPARLRAIELRMSRYDFRLGRYEVVCERLDRIAGHSPLPPWAAMLKARSAIALARFDDAITTLELPANEVALADRGSYWLLLSQAKSLSGDYSAAIECWNEALKVEPTNPDLHARLVSLRKKSTASDLSGAVLAKLADVHPEDPEIQFELIGLLFDAEEPDKIDARISNLGAAFPDDLRVWELRAKFCETTGDYAGIIAAANRVLSDPEAVLSLSQSMILLKVDALEKSQGPKKALEIGQQYLARSYFERLADRCLLIAQKNGLTEHHAKILNKVRAEKRLRLPDNLQEGLKRVVVDRDNAINRLRRATRLLLEKAIESQESEEKRLDIYERAAWGGNAHKQLRNWLFYADEDKLSQIDDLVDEIDFDELRADIESGRGAVLVASHLGPNPVLVRTLSKCFDNFSLLGMPRKGGKIANLISTGLGRSYVIRHCIKVLRERGLIAMAGDYGGIYVPGDGRAMKPQTIENKYSPLGAKLAFRCGVPLYWGEARWHGEKVRLTASKIADPGNITSEAEWIATAREKFAERITASMTGDPANLAIGLRAGRTRKASSRQPVRAG